jgi:hypothetical protein
MRRPLFSFFLSDSHSSTVKKKEEKKVRLPMTVVFEEEKN